MKPKAAPRLPRRACCALIGAACLMGPLALLAAPAPTPNPVPGTHAAASNSAGPAAPAASAPAAESAAAPAKAARTTDAPVFDPQRLAAPVRLHYRVTSNRFPYRLGGELIWQHDRQRYQAQLSFGAFGLSRAQVSQGRIGADGLAPERFVDKARTESSARFDRVQGRISFSSQTPDLPLQPGAQDRLSVLLQIGALVASAPGRLAPGAAIVCQTVGASGGELWRFTLEKAETLNLPDGAQPAWKLARQPREAGDQRVEVWLAPVLGYLPARIRITEANGDTIDQVWQSSSPAGPPD